MENKDELLLQANHLLLLYLKRRQLVEKNRKKHRFWIRRVFKERNRQGLYYTLFEELRLFDGVLLFFFRTDATRSGATPPGVGRRSHGPSAFLQWSVLFLCKRDNYSSCDSIVWKRHEKEQNNRYFYLRKQPAVSQSHFGFHMLHT